MNIRQRLLREGLEYSNNRPQVLGGSLNLVSPYIFLGDGTISIEGDVQIGTIKGGAALSMGQIVALRGGTVRILEGARISNAVYMLADGADIVIGKNVLIGHEVQILTVNGHMVDPLRRLERDAASSVSVGDGAWLGARSMLLKGVTVGAGAIVSAGVCLRPGSVVGVNCIARLPAVVTGPIQNSPRDAADPQ